MARSHYLKKLAEGKNQKASDNLFEKETVRYHLRHDEKNLEYVMSQPKEYSVPLIQDPYIN